MDKFNKDYRATGIFQLALQQLKKSQEEGGESYLRDARFSARNGFELLSEPDVHLIPEIRIPIHLLQEDEFLEIIDKLRMLSMRITVKINDKQKDIESGSLFVLLANFILFYAPHFPQELQSTFDNVRDYGVYLKTPETKPVINMRGFYFEKDTRVPWVLHRFVRWARLFKEDTSEIVFVGLNLDMIKEAFPPDSNEEFFDTVPSSEGS